MDEKSSYNFFYFIDDFSDWKSFAPAEAMSKDDAKLCLKNISALHAKFWKDKKTIEESEPSGSDQDTRAGHSSKFSYYFRKSVVNNVKKYFKNIKEGKWGEYKALRLTKGAVLPYWMTIGLSGKFLHLLTFSLLSCFQRMRHTLFLMTLW